VYDVCDVGLAWYRGDWVVCWLRLWLCGGKPVLRVEEGVDPDADAECMEYCGWCNWVCGEVMELCGDVFATTLLGGAAKVESVG